MQITKQIGAEIKTPIETVIEDGALTGFTLDGYALTYEANPALTLEENLEVLIEKRDSFIEYASENQITDSAYGFISQFIADVESDLSVVYNARKSAQNDAVVGKDAKPTGTVIAHSDATKAAASDSKSTQSSVETKTSGDTNGTKQTRKQNTGPESD